MHRKYLVRVGICDAFYIDIKTQFWKIDLYILGVNEPVTEFVGKVIAVIHRLNDIEDKWVVAPEGKSFTKEEITNSVAFQEKFFDIEIVM